LPRNVQPQAKLNSKGRRWLILKYSFPTKTIFKSKITCKRLTYVSFVSTGQGDWKPSRMSFFPLSSLVVSSLTSSNFAKGECDRNKRNCSKDRRNVGAKWGGNVKPQHGEGWTRHNVNILHVSCLFACHF
jgi:hypothetical protein